MSIHATQTKASDYLYEHVTSKVLFEDMGFSDGAPRPGQPLPRFRLPDTEGRTVGTEDFIGNRPVLLVTGSYTCPMTLASNPGLKRLYDRFSSRVQFLMLHVREAHPGEHHDQSRTFEEKLRYAQQLKSRDDLPWPLLVDDPEGTVHRRLDSKPNAAFLADADGTIVFRSLWAGDEHALAQALESVAHGERPRREESQRRLVPMAEGLGVMREVLHQSGPRAERDLWRAAPPMAMMAWLAGLFRPLEPKWRTAAAMASVVGVAVAASWWLRRR